MTIEQTVEIPASHRLTIEVPPEVPAGRTILAFTPAPAAAGAGQTPAEPPLNAAERRRRYLTMNAEERAVEDAREAELFRLHADELNREAADVLSCISEGETRAGGSRDTPAYLRRKAMLAQSIEYINRHAEELNREMEEVLKDQGDIFRFGSPFTEDDFVPPCMEGKQ